MRYYFAPLEGLTDSIFRSLHSKYFPGVDRYYTPFLSPTVHRGLTAREAREIPRADTLTYEAVPQLLTKVAEDFLWLAGVCADLGYKEVNLNTGCPSGTVVSKGKGSGMLRNPEDLDRFLEAVFAGCPIDITVKTRLGLEKPEEFIPLLEERFDFVIKKEMMETEAVQKLMKVYTEYSGRSDAPKSIGGGTYAKSMPNVVAFGPIFPGDEVREHKPDEFIEIPKLMKNAQIIASAMYEMAK